MHETDAIFFSAGPTPCFSPVSPVSPFEFVYSLYTFSSPNCRDFARALRNLCSLPPSMSNRYALSVRDKNILANGHYYIQINGWCSMQRRAPQIGPQSLNRRYASFLLFCLKCSEAFASGQLKILPVSIAAPSVYIQGAITKCSEAFASGQSKILPISIAAPSVYIQGTMTKCSEAFASGQVICAPVVSTRAVFRTLAWCMQALPVNCLFF